MWIDRLLASLAPEAALRRARARLALHNIQAAYDGAMAGECRAVYVDG